jgi:hypothetical protein
VALVSCQLVAGIESRHYDPVLSGCTLPSSPGGPQVRVANFVPTSDLVDVCFRSSGTSDWGRPVLLDGGTECSSASNLGAAGFAYTNVSIAFSLPWTNIDVKFVPAGSTCDATSLSEGDGITLARNAVNTIMHIGGNGQPMTVSALPEADVVTQAGQSTRFVHACPGTGPLVIGITVAANLPTTISIPVLSNPISFGGTVPAGTTAPFQSATLGDNGYLSILTGTFSFGASLDGDASNKALFAYQFPGGIATYSMYAIGVAGDNLHPLRALICEEDSSPTLKNPMLLNCTPSTLSGLSVDVFNPALYGPNSPYFNDRKDLVASAIHNRDSDITCLLEVDQAQDKQNILQGATTTVSSGQGPYGYVYQPPAMNLSTQFSNQGVDQNGNPPPAATVPCNGVDSTLINNLISCGEQNCSTSKGDPNGTLLSSTDCLIANCAAPFIAVQGASVACYDCLVVYIASNESWANSQTHCTTDAIAPMGFDGASNTMILSKYPLNNSDVYILPSTLYRRTVLYSQVQLEDQTVDFYCGFLMTTLNAQALPYQGNYGNGAANSQDGWDNEQLYEAQLVTKWIGQKSGSNPAIVVGDWRSSIGIGADAGVTPLTGTNLPLDLNGQTMLYFKQTGWQFAAPPSSDQAWGPQCNYCPSAENPYNKAESYFVSQPMLVNFAANSTTDESLIFTEGVVQLTGAAPDAGLGPVSPYYGVNFRVIRPK